MYFHKNQCKSGLDMLEFKILTNFDLKDRELTAGDDHYSLYLTHNEGILQIFLPHFVRYDNVKPFSLDDSVQLDVCREEILKKISELIPKGIRSTEIKKLEVNLTLPARDNETISSVLNLLNRASLSSKIPNVVYMRASKKNQLKLAYDSVIGRRKQKYFILKAYNKTQQIEQEHSYPRPVCEPPQLRIEVVFIDRMLSKMFGDDLSIENVLSQAAFLCTLRQYKQIYEDEILRNVRNYRDSVTRLLDERLDETGSIKEALLGMDELIVDRAIIFESVRRWCNRSRPQRNVTREMRKAKEIAEQCNYPKGVFSVLRTFHEACG